MLDIYLFVYDKKFRAKISKKKWIRNSKLGPPYSYLQIFTLIANKIVANT